MTTEYERGMDDGIEEGRERLVRVLRGYDEEEVKKNPLAREIFDDLADRFFAGADYFRREVNVYGEPVEPNGAYDDSLRAIRPDLFAETVPSD